MRIEDKPNCVGFVFHHFRITDSEVYIDPSSVDGELQRLFQVANPIIADTLAIRIANERAVLAHLALIDLKDPSMVVHRLGKGGVVKEPLEMILQIYGIGKSTSQFQASYLKFLGVSPRNMPNAPRSIRSYVPTPVRNILNELGHLDDEIS